MGRLEMPGHTLRWYGDSCATEAPSPYSTVLSQGRDGLASLCLPDRVCEEPQPPAVAGHRQSSACFSSRVRHRALAS